MEQNKNELEEKMKPLVNQHEEKMKSNGNQYKKNLEEIKNRFELEKMKLQLTNPINQQIHEKGQRKTKFFFRKFRVFLCFFVFFVFFVFLGRNH